MPPIELLLTFILSSVLLALAPGPDNIFVLTQSALSGWKAGVIVTIGLCTGLIFHTSAVALGVAVIFKTSALAFSILKYIGAAYLLYLAYLSFSAGKMETEETKKLSFGKLYRRGIIMNITNPKVSIFFLAFLPQFTDPKSGSVTIQILLLGLLFMISAFTVFSLISITAGKIGTFITRSAKVQNIMNKIAAIVFVAIALNLIIIQQ